jgi:hypothetical protein
MPRWKRLNFEQRGDHAETVGAANQSAYRHEVQRQSLASCSEVWQPQLRQVVLVLVSTFRGRPRGAASGISPRGRWLTIENPGQYSATLCNGKSDFSRDRLIALVVSHP